MFEDSLVQYYLEHMEKDHRRDILLRQKYGQLDLLAV